MYSPPPLIGPNSAADGGATPPVMTARKIMKRGGLGGDSLAAQLLTKDDADDAKDKKDLTREERENRYKEARARIFRDFKEETAESLEASTKTSDKDVSRSSSATGAKKNKKKKPRDDEFEPRSAFTGVSPFSPPSLKSGSDATFYNPFAPYAMGMTQPQAGLAAHFDPNQQAHMQMQNQYAPQPNGALPGWQQQQGGQPYMMPAPASGYPSQGYYDNNGVFNNMSSPPNMASQLTPRPAHQTLSTQVPNYSQQDGTTGWQQNYVNQHGMQNGMMNSGYIDPNMLSNSMVYAMNPGYAQDPQAIAQAMAQQAAYGYPGNYSRQQFNPKTQSFVPGVWGGAAQPMPNAMQYLPNQAMSPMQANMSPMPQLFPQQQQQQYFAQSLNANSRPMAQSRSSPATTTPARGPQSGSSGGSSIAKWGTPSTLPPKPPSTLPAKPPPAANFPTLAAQAQSLPPKPYTGNGVMNGASNSAAKVGGLR